MNQKRSESGAKLHRRDVIRAGAVALAAAAIPGVGSASHNPLRSSERIIDSLRADYLRLIEAIAEELRPQFEAGEFRGSTQEDFRGAKAAISPAGDPDDPCLPFDEHHRAVVGALPLERLRAEVVRRLQIEDERVAGLILALSPANHQFALSWMASDAASDDVIRVARLRGWYTPAADEMPSNKVLGVS